jgi:eukaryotic-like serine/threonine-protein kinase
MKDRNRSSSEPLTEIFSPKSKPEQDPMLEDPRVVEALEQYLAAVEAGDRPNREEFLRRHADIASALGECLDGLDALHQTATSSKAPHAEGSSGGVAGDWQPGTPLGDFRIIREIGRGGMGVVYEAEQLSLSRRIALKVLPFAFTLDPRQLQRFKNEARAAGHLHHTNIVPIYSVGMERAVHFYAMQYIEGKTLAQVIEGLRQIGVKKELVMPFPMLTKDGPTAETPQGIPRSNSSASGETAVQPVGVLATAFSTSSTQFYRSVARLGIQAAEALEHAHQCGVVHRDIKPANLIVDDQGKLWVTDFGLAQFHADAAGLTQTGDLLGTLRYMSPEQAGGQRVLLDHRTDIYSLGATLYELLTLEPLFDGPDRQTLLHKILFSDPQPPRSIQKSIPVELETIILKALGKMPAERYATAQEMAGDLSRFLHHEPILARRTSLITWVRKWARRHPSLVASSVVLCLLTAVGSLIAAGLIKSAYDRELLRTQQAEERFLLARQAVDEMVKVSQEDLADIQPLQGVRKRLLEATLIYYQKLIEQSEDDPNARANLKAARADVAKIIDDLAAIQGAGQLFLLSEPSVLEDLQLKPGQKEKLELLGKQMSEQGQKLSSEFQWLSKEERDRRFVELARSDEVAVASVLSPQQLKRLGQIDLQLQGLRAFEDSGVVAALKLTSEQKDRIRAIQFEGWFGGPGGKACDAPGPGRRHQDPEEENRSRMEKVVALLTTEQKHRWEEMTGTEFRGRVHMKFNGPQHHGPKGPPPGR